MNGRQDAGHAESSDRSRATARRFYAALAGYYTGVLIVLSVLAVGAVVAGVGDVAVLLLALAGVPWTMRLVVRRLAKRRG